MQNSRPEDSQQQEILVCNLGAGWSPSTLNTSTYEYDFGNVNSEISDANSVARGIQSWHSKELVPRISQAEKWASLSSSVFVLSSYSFLSINVSLFWSQNLNPIVSDLNATVFHQLMLSNITNRDSAVSAEIILSSLLANGLSKIGIESFLQENFKIAPDSQGVNVADSNDWFREEDVFIVDPELSKD